MESMSSDTNTSVFASPDSVVEPPNGRKFETSVSVSSLAEKFEKSGDFSKSEDKTCSEGKLASESDSERSHRLPDCIMENNSIPPEINGSAFQPTAKAEDEVISSYKEVNSCSASSENNLNHAAVFENSKKTDVLAFEASSDPIMSDKEVKNVNEGNASQRSASAEDAKNVNCISRNSSKLFTEPQTSNEIAERVSSLLNEFSKMHQNPASGTMLTKEDPPKIFENAAPDSSSEPKQNLEGISKNLSLKELEQSFIDALKMVNGEEEAKKTGDTLPVPSIQITEASDREDNSSDDAEDSKPKKDVETEVKTSVEKSMDDSNEATSTCTASQGDVKSDSEVSAEERKAFFYISSSDLPAEPPQESVENSNDIEQSSGDTEERAESTRTQESNETESSCPSSKTCHGMTFLVSFVISIFGCILYGFAHDGKIPDYCEYLGLIIAVLSGIVGTFSCICYSCLEICPRPSRAGYEMIPDTEYIPSLPQNEAANAQSLDDSWSSEKERAFRRQNGMSSTRTSAASLKSEQSGDYMVIKKSEHRELVDKTEKLKKGVMELIESFNAFMSKLEPIDELNEMESGMVNGY